MKIIPFISLIFLSVSLNGQVSFERYFTDKVLRFDFMLAGNSSKTLVYPESMKEEPFYGGSRTNLIDPFNYGNFRYEIFDAEENILIYSRGFSTLFREWQTTAEAKSMEKSFHEIATMPFPINKVRFILSRRDHDGSFKEIFETEIDPDDYFIRKEKPVNAGITRIIYSGDPAECVDLAFIPEGYKADEMKKFRADARKLAEMLLSEPPYNDYKDKFNIWAVEAVSEESGTDVPGENIYVNSVLNSTFYTFDLDRYLTTSDMKTISDYAGAVPHDNIVVLINSSRYGGGGVYNYYSGTTTDNIKLKYLFIHEFGHGFAGLADEYFESAVSYENFYPLDVEPWEPNITTLVNFDSKWKNLISKKTPVPTPSTDEFKDVVGLFEGGGYSAKGIYRPKIECTMRMSTPQGLCPVCQNAIRKMIEFYTE